MGLSPQARKLRARLGAYAQHAKHDTRQTTAAARLAFQQSFVEKIRIEYPDLEEDEVQRRADAARRAWYARISLKSARVRAGRSARKAATSQPIGRRAATEDTAQ